MNNHCLWCGRRLEETQRTQQLVGKAAGMPDHKVLVHHECWLIIQRSPTATGYSIGGEVKRKQS